MSFFYLLTESELMLLFSLCIFSYYLFLLFYVYISKNVLQVKMLQAKKKKVNC